MYRAIVELDTLSNTDRPGSKYEYLFLQIGLYRFILAAKYRVIIWGACFKLCRTGINHLKCSNNIIVIAHLADLFFGLAGKICNDIIRELDTLCFF